MVTTVRTTRYRYTWALEITVPALKEFPVKDGLHWSSVTRLVHLMEAVWIDNRLDVRDLSGPGIP